MPNNEVKIKTSSYLGNKILVRIFDTDASPLLIGGQRTASWNDTAETIDATTKTGGILNYNELMKAVGVKAEELPQKEYNNFKEYIPGQIDWKVSIDGATPSSDEAVSIIQAKKNAGEAVLVSVIDLGQMSEKIGIAIVTEMSEEGPGGDLASYSLSLQGSGEYIKRDYTPPVKPTKITGAAVTVPVGQEKELVLTFEPTDAEKNVNFYVKDEATAINSGGKVKGLKEGTTTAVVSSISAPYVEAEVAITVTTP